VGLRIGSLNVWGLPEPFAEDVHPRIQAIADALPSLDLDVLAFQEVWTPGARHLLLEGARRAGFAHRFVSPAAPGGGLLLVSRVPFESAGFERFRFRGDLERLDRAEYLGGKGLLSARLITQDGPLWLVNTHLHARYRRGQPQLDSAVRLAQLMQIVEFASRHDEPLVVVGDFNCDPGDPEYVVWTGLTGVRDVAAGPGAPPTISRANYYKRNRSDDDRRIDFVFARDGAGVAVESRGSRRLFDRDFPIGDSPRPVSDHYGVQAELRLVGSAAAVRVESAPVATPEIVERARELLQLGRAEADRRERVFAEGAGLFALGSAFAVAASRNRVVSRRRFLRRSLLFAGFAALGPAAGFTTVARVDAPDQDDAFERALGTLDRFENGRRTSIA